MRLMGEGTSFRKSLHVEVRDDAVSPYGGVVLLREFEERVCFLARWIEEFFDPRRMSHRLHSIATLFRFAVYRIALGLPDVQDAERLRHDPVLRACLAQEGQDRLPGVLPGKSTLHRFLTKVLTLRPNRRILFRGLVESAMHPLLTRPRSPAVIFVDLDSTMIETHGNQEGSANNGYFRKVCYHALSLSLAPFGTTLGILLRPGNVHTAQHAKALVMPILEQVRDRLGGDVEIVLRADSGFASPALLDALERGGFSYMVRLRETTRLRDACERISKRRPGRPSKIRTVVRHYGFSFRSCGWKKSRRVVARSVFEPGQLYPDWTFVCVHRSERASRRSIIRAYLDRGRSEQVHDIFKNELHGSLMSHHRLIDNQVRAWLTALAKNLLLCFEFSTREPASPTRPATVRRRLLVIPATLIRHARSLVLRLSASEPLARRLDGVAGRIEHCRPPTLRAAG